MARDTLSARRRPGRPIDVSSHRQPGRVCARCLVVLDLELFAALIGVQAQRLGDG